MDFLKALFGVVDGKPESLTWEQLEAKLKAAGIKPANLADGGYVSKDKYAAEQEKAKTLGEQLEAANTTIQSYKDMDIDGIKKSAADWEQKYATDTQALQDKLKAMEYGHAVDLFMSGYNFTSKAAAAGIRSEFDAKKFELKDGQFTGAKEWMEGLAKSDDYKAAFVTDGPKPPSFGDPNPAPKPEPTRLPLSELMARKNADPNFQVKYD